MIGRSRAHHDRLAGRHGPRPAKLPTDGRFGRSRRGPMTSSPRCGARSQPSTDSRRTAVLCRHAIGSLARDSSPSPSRTVKSTSRSSLRAFASGDVLLAGEPDQLCVAPAVFRTDDRYVLGTVQMNTKVVWTVVLPLDML